MLAALIKIRLTARSIPCCTTLTSPWMKSPSSHSNQTRRRLQQYVALFLSIILSAATNCCWESYITREPNHTSILTGEGWVMELLAGHPEHIHCELGVHHSCLWSPHLGPSGDGTWQLKMLGFHLKTGYAIFLVCICDSLTIRHIGGAFSEVNETIFMGEFHFILLS